VENFQMLKDRQTSDSVVENEHRRGRTNLLNWDGRGKPPGLFPSRHDGEPEDQSPQSDPAGPDTPEEDS
jgi:nitrate reductase beta subunit